MDVPGFLRGKEKILEEYGRRIRAKHCRGTKHHIKFDDGEITIFLNIRKMGDRDWSRVYPVDAREWVRSMRRNEAEKINKNFNQVEATGSNNTPIGSLTFSKPSGNNHGGELHADGGRGVLGSGLEDQDKRTTKVATWTGRAGSATSDML